MISIHMNDFTGRAAEIWELTHLGQVTWTVSSSTGMIEYTFLNKEDETAFRLRYMCD